MDERTKNIFEAIEKLESRINAYWNFYTIVVLAVIGWLFSRSEPFTGFQKVCLIVAISVFFVANFSVMRAGTKRVVAFESELNVSSKECIYKSSALKEELANNTMPGRLVASYLLHAIVDVTIVLAIWLN